MCQILGIQVLQARAQIKCSDDRDEKPNSEGLGHITVNLLHSTMPGTSLIREGGREGGMAITVRPDNNTGRSVVKLTLKQPKF